MVRQPWPQRRCHRPGAGVNAFAINGAADATAEEGQQRTPPSAAPPAKGQHRRLEKSEMESEGLWVFIMSDNKKSVNNNYNRIYYHILGPHWVVLDGIGWY